MNEQSLSDLQTHSSVWGHQSVSTGTLPQYRYMKSTWMQHIGRSSSREDGASAGLGCCYDPPFANVHTRMNVESLSLSLSQPELLVQRSHTRTHIYTIKNPHTQAWDDVNTAEAVYRSVKWRRLLWTQHSLPIDGALRAIEGYFESPRANTPTNIEGSSLGRPL